ncbi:hypothetical protein V3Q90_10890 [Flavobacterium oreochromis]|uniref:Uncharacterized protein n=1 Tax=Flavobacterium oreochromis TaxID=2906078 RepID=A0ABW8PBW7_9FLAO
MEFLIQGNGTIKLKKDFTLGKDYIFINDELIAIDESENSGSEGRIFEIKNDLNALLGTNIFNKSLNTLSFSEDMFQEFQPFLKQLESGCYIISIGQLDYKVITSATFNYHPFFVDSEYVYSIKNKEKLSRKKIQQYKKDIEIGKKFISILLKYHCLIENEYIETPFYLLDGHHKVQAYKELALSPFYLIINRKVKELYQMDIDYDSIK